MPSKLSVVTVRMTPELHQRLKLGAMVEAVRREDPSFSMNRMCVERLKLYPSLCDDLHEAQTERDRLLAAIETALDKEEDDDVRAWLAYSLDPAAHLERALGIELHRKEATHE
jgi:hypothetical protein